MLNTKLNDQNPQHTEAAEILALDILENHFNKIGWPVDVTPKKLMDRYRITENEDKNCVTVEIERHRAVLGDTYIPGVPMSAYQTYWMQYNVNLQTGEVDDLGEQDGDIAINISGLVDSHLSFDYFWLSIEPEEDTPGIYRISESVMGESKLVSDYKEMESFVLSFCPGMVEYFKDRLGDEDIDLRIIERYVELYEIELREQILHKLYETASGILN
ncbi:hypothetical protein [Methylotuvimicrobium sp. KM1]|uniref:hypothetical protein n=1 Tax=Methylotuvimicrobium sp. KM1 TaxID=3377707 RepID=UPI00384CF90C